MPPTAALLADVATIAIAPWPDPVVERVGHDIKSDYVERFWLSVLGPSTTLLLRRLVDELEAQPEGFTLDLAETAQALGVGMRGGRTSPFLRAVDRSCRFGATRLVGRQTLAVRRKLAPLNHSQVGRLPEALRTQHEHWQTTDPGRPSPTEMRQRARQLALSLLEIGEDVQATERQLHRWRFHPAVAHEALRWAIEHATNPVIDLRDPARPGPVSGAS